MIVQTVNNIFHLIVIFSLKILGLQISNKKGSQSIIYILDGFNFDHQSTIFFYLAFIKIQIELQVWDFKTENRQTDTEMHRGDYRGRPGLKSWGDESQSPSCTDTGSEDPPIFQEFIQISEWNVLV